MAIIRPFDYYTNDVAQCIAVNLAMPDRFVGASRARALRKRGETIRFDHFTVRGRARYRWVAACPRDPHAPRWSSARVMLLGIEREWECEGAPFAAFIDAVQQQVIDAMRIPAPLIGTGPRLGKATSA